MGGGACSRSWEALSDPQGSGDCARAIKKKPAPDTRRAPPSRHVNCMPPLGAARLLSLTHYLTRIFTHCPEDSLAGRDRARLTPGSPQVDRQVSAHGWIGRCPPTAGQVSAILVMDSVWASEKLRFALPWRC